MIEQPQVRLRRATSADVPLLRRWDDKPHVIGATGADGGSDWNWEYELPREVTWRELLIGEVNGRPVGIMQVIDPQSEETHYWGGIESGLRTRLRNSNDASRIGSVLFRHYSARGTNRSAREQHARASILRETWISSRRSADVW